ncbi:Lrp/AsnC family transcriptional regulator [Thalassobius vesicularis]|uniref:Siroheme decarboxylase NirG subunit n=1 Tax=Thalassobius vesicularis TaxID=1294297 RepID=A0A4S3M7I5_9RHOB|nr:AsnC family transcriptional regulator [Thalassobius vesicularis]THD73040.1 Lrp/AsnC family transcriptional regulator [Thalassobius vesicularis]
MRRITLPPDALDSTDRVLINRLQDGFPLSSHPFAEIGEELGLDQSEVISRISHLRDIGAVTRFGPFLDAAAMGGAFCLCAIAVPEDRFEDVMTLVNAHPEVAHNYERIHRLNMWFVLACDKASQIDRVADRIEAETGLTVLRFPKLKEFFIGFRVHA